MNYGETEWDIHQMVVNRLENAKFKELGFEYYHVPNGIHITSWSQKRKLSRAGVRAGIPDLTIIRWPGTADMTHYVWEIKSDKGRLSHSQEYWLKYFDQCGYKTAVTYGWKEAEAKLEEWQIP